MPVSTVKLFALLLIFVATEISAQNTTPPLIPLSDNIQMTSGNFILSDKTSVTGGPKVLHDYLTAQLKSFTGITTSLKQKRPHNTITLKADPSFTEANNEAYNLTVTKHNITIISSTEEGVFRGIQTLFQMIPSSVKEQKSGSFVEIPCCTISDKPQFPWRGLNLDCCRHFMSKDFVKRYIDILAYYKFNKLHWHLTDDQGWRIEINKYPKLTQIGAFRKEADGSIYGGFYTQNDIKEVVAYAKSRFITIIPEIEMPGHAVASLSAYPENSCTGGPFAVETNWGIFKDIYCAGRDSTFLFLQNILDEVVQLFPGEYIHIGGDEAPKTRWKECPRCQSRIKAEGLKDEEELQSWFTKRIVNYLTSKGRKVIGWDEVLLGGPTPGITIQSWQGYQGAITAAKVGIYSICSPWSHTYLDRSAEDLDLAKVYSFNPIPETFTQDERKYILGSEANSWSEYLPQEKIDGNLFPRILALSEVLWTSTQHKNYDNFYSRLQRSYSDMAALGINYGIESRVYTYQTSFNKSENQFAIKINTLQKGAQVRYTTNGSKPDFASLEYKEPIILSQNATLKFASFYNNHFTGSEKILSVYLHKALASNVTLMQKYSDQYNAGGAAALTDGIKGTTNFHDGLWQGYYGVDCEAIIDLGKETEISKVTPSFLSHAEAWIFLPEKVEISFSNDKANFQQAAVVNNDIPVTNSDIFTKDYSASFNNITARYIKVKAVSIKKCPSWHLGAGKDCWLFIDEIAVE